MRHALHRTVGFITCFALVGCASTPPTRDDDDRAFVERGLQATEERSGAANSRLMADRPPAMLRAEPVSWATLAPRLSEAAGAVVLEEIVLERLLEGESARAGITITPAMIQREREMLQTAVGEAAGASTSEESQRVLERVRRERGVGPVRFESQLRRSAMLRALVETQVTLTEEALRMGYELRYGASYRVRVIVTPSARQASEAIRRLEAGVTFGEVAAEMSTDDSAQRGGLIDSINPADTSWPESLRAIVPTLEPGQRSDPISVDQGYAVVRLDAIIPAPADRPSFEQARTMLVQDVRARQEQLLMGRLARRLLDEADLTVLDPSLGWATRDR